MRIELFLKKQYIFGAAILLVSMWLSGCGPVASNTPSGNGNSNSANGVNSNANSSPTLLTCDDAQVIKDILAGVNADPYLKLRLGHLNAYSYNCVVSLMGYTDTLDLFKKFYKIASDAPNVRKVEINQLYIDKDSDPNRPDALGKCGSGMTLCGEICVPPGQCRFGT